MKVISHYPQTPEGMKELRKRSGIICAETAFENIRKLRLSPKDEKKLIEMICKKIEKKLV